MSTEDDISLHGADAPEGMFARFNQAVFLNARFYAVLYVALSSLIAISLFTTHPVLYTKHEWQHFIRGLSESALFKKENQTVPSNLYRLNYGMRDIWSDKQRPDRLNLAKDAHVPDVKARFGYPKEDELIPQTDGNADATPLVSRIMPIPAVIASIPLAQDDRTEIIMPPNTERYPFVDYLPQIIAGNAGALFDLNPATILALTRAICLISGIIFGYIILRLLPAYHLPVMLLLLLPSDWLVRVNQYPDYVVNTSALLFFALLLRALSRKTPVGRNSVLLFMLVGTILSISKLVYFPLVFSLLLLPTSLFGSMRKRILCVGGIIFICVMASIATAYKAMEVGYGVDMLESASPDEDVSLPQPMRRGGSSGAQNFYETLQDPETLVTALIYTYTSQRFFRGCWSNLFAWRLHHKPALLFNTFFKKPYFRLGLFSDIVNFVQLLQIVLPLFFLMLLGRRSTSHSDTVHAQEAYLPGINERLLLMAVTLCTLILVSTAIFIDTKRTGDLLILGIQGRYFAPIIPFLALALSIRVPRWLFATYSVVILSLALIIYGVTYYAIIFA